MAVRSSTLFLEKSRNQKQWRSPQFATYRSQPTRFALTFVVFYFRDSEAFYNRVMYVVLLPIERLHLHMFTRD